MTRARTDTSFVQQSSHPTNSIVKLLIWLTRTKTDTRHLETKLKLYGLIKNEY